MGATVLIVDDDPAVLAMAANILEKAGYRTMLASNGIEALHVFQSYAEHIDVVVTDLVMPEMSGVELAERIHAAYPRMNIVLMSGYVPDEYRGVCESYPFLAKPFRTEKLLAAVQGCRL